MRRFCRFQTQTPVSEEKYGCVIESNKPLNVICRAECICPYEKSDIKLADEWGFGEQIIIQRNPKPFADGICRDFKILSEIEQELLPILQEKFGESQ